MQTELLPAPVGAEISGADDDWMNKEYEKRRGRITEIHKAEAAALRRLWEGALPKLRERGHGTQASFGQEFDIGNQAAVGFFLNGHTALSMKAAKGFARGLGCKISDFSPRLAAEAAATAQLAAPEAAWPFEAVPRDLFEALTEREKGEVEAAMLRAITDILNRKRQLPGFAPPESISSHPENRRRRANDR